MRLGKCELERAFNIQGKNKNKFSGPVTGRELFEQPSKYQLRKDSIDS